MNPGDKVIMIEFPTENYAMEYCTDNGLYIGCVCYYVGILNGFVMLKTDHKFEVGSEFLTEYFKKNLRVENLKVLLD